MTMAEKAKLEFENNGVIPNNGQTITEKDIGDIHMFPDGSAGMHWKDPPHFSLAEVEED